MDPAVLSSSKAISRQIPSTPLRLSLGLKSHISQSPLPSPSPSPLPSSLLFPHRARWPSSGSQLWRGIQSSSSSRGSGWDSTSPWDDKPHELLPGGRRSYFDEQDVVSFLDPPKELIPLDPASYNPAAYLWKKIGDVPEERRHRLLFLLKERLISRTWELAGTRYQDHKLAKQSASTLLSMEDNSATLEYWSCRTSKGPMPIAWMNDFKKAIFRGRDVGMFGRIFTNGAIPASLKYFYGPLYFRVRQIMEVMPTEQPCDLAYEFGDGLLDLQDIPNGFPEPALHREPFDDHLIIYIRHVGPGVLVGQAWQEGKILDQVPKKFCGEILMVRDYTASEGSDRSAVHLKKRS